MNVLRYIAVYFSKPIWSFVSNCVFWLFRLNKIGAARREMSVIKGLKIETLMNLFKWTEDTIGDWTPWVMTIICNDFTDDCDGAATLAKWWFKQHGVEAEILNLYSATEGHTICVTKDRTKMVTNERVVHLFPETWEQDIMRYFRDKYEVII